MKPEEVKGKKGQGNTSKAASVNDQSILITIQDFEQARG
jgi:hypothetical protein